MCLKLCVLTLIRCPFHPRVTAVARKRPRSFLQKCKWQVTPEHAYTFDPTKSEWADLIRPFAFGADVLSSLFVSSDVDSVGRRARCRCTLFASQATRVVCLCTYFGPRVLCSVDSACSKHGAGALGLLLRPLAFCADVLTSVLVSSAL